MYIISKTVLSCMFNDQTTPICIVYLLSSFRNNNNDIFKPYVLQSYVYFITYFNRFYLCSKNREDIEQYQIFYKRRQLVYITINVTRIKEKYWFFL